MKIQKLGTQLPRVNFEAGITKLYSDFDGTYIPKKYNHDSVCNYTPLVNRGDFKSSMDKIWQLFGDLRGSNNKFNFTITTGRNIAETNYFLNKLRSQDLWVPLPEKLITCNGQDEYLLNVKDEEDFFKTDKPAFVKTNINNEKRKTYQEKGWDYNAITSKIKNLFLKDPHYNVDIIFKDKKQALTQAIAEHLGIHEGETFPIIKVIETKKFDLENTRKYLEEHSKIEPKTQKDKELYDWYMGELALAVHKETARPRIIFEDIPTTRSSREYNGGISLQAALEKRFVDKSIDFIAFSDDGELGVRIAFNNEYRKNMESYINNPELTNLIKNKNATISKINKGSFAGCELEIKPKDIDKFEDTKKEVDNIIKNKTNDLVIVSGDGSNDAKMLTISEYIKHTDKTFIPTTKEEEQSFKDIPLVAIFVDNRSEKERAEQNSELSVMLEKNKYCNYDGRLRFIHVDPNDTNKPQTLEEAIKMAVASYANSNEEFKNNLSPEMQKSLADYKISYPQDKKLADEFNTKIGNEASEKIFIQEEFAKIEEFCTEILSIELLGNTEEAALDENSNMEFEKREKVILSLASMLAIFKELEARIGKENATKQLKLCILDSIGNTSGPQNNKNKLLTRLFIDNNISNVPENPQEFLNRIKNKIKIDPIAPETSWQKFIRLTKSFIKTKTGKFTIGAIGLATIITGIALINNNSSKPINPHTSK